MEVLKPLAQSAPPATTLTDIYTVPAATAAVVSKLHVCNRGANGSFRISRAPLGAADAVEHYIYRDEAIKANQTFPIMEGVVLEAGDVIRVYGSHGNFSFNMYGSEVS